jgi:hypothetical protein
MLAAVLKKRLGKLPECTCLSSARSATAELRRLQAPPSDYLATAREASGSGRTNPRR